MENYKQVKKVEKIIALCMLAFVFVFVFAIYSFVVVGRQKKASAEYSELIASLEAEKKDLESSNEYIASEEYIEEQARSYLGMIKDGETLYIFK